MASKSIVVRRGGWIHLTDLSDFVDIDKVVSYSIKLNKDKTATLKLYDKNKKLVKPYVKK